jgi:hypothetical protein
VAEATGDGEPAGVGDAVGGDRSSLDDEIVGDATGIGPAAGVDSEKGEATGVGETPGSAANAVIIDAHHTAAKGRERVLAIRRLRARLPKLARALALRNVPVSGPGRDEGFAESGRKPSEEMCSWWTIFV